MVSTRNHPSTFPEPTASPTKSSRSTPVPTLSPPTSTSPVSSPSRTMARSSKTAKTSAGAWSHTPSNMTLIWLTISLPLVIWDSIYVFGRPHTMPGGKYVWPFYTPYELYGTIDYIYGWKAYNAHNGFTAAQGFLNIIETIGYFVYLYLVYTYGQQEQVEGRGAPPTSVFGKLAEARTVYGKVAAYSTLIAFSTALMTLSKTVLYWLNEAFSGFDNIGHNDAVTLFFYWIVPNGAWIVFPTYMLYVFGAEILQGLELASGETKKTK